MITYRDIPGWFDEQDAEFYARMVSECSFPATFVEVGCWFGRSTVCLAQEIQKQKKHISVFAVDTWRGSPSDTDQMEVVAKPGESILMAFCKNVVNAEIAEVVVPMEMDSVSAAEIFDLNSLAFVFIDADHDEPCVATDIAAWLPKIGHGGVIAGHDYEADNCPGVKAAVDKAFPDGVEIHGTCWFKRA